MWRIFFTRSVGGHLVLKVAGSLAAAMIAGFGWKLGADAYDVTKRRLARNRQAGDPQAE